MLRLRKIYQLQKLCSSRSEKEIFLIGKKKKKKNLDSSNYTFFQKELTIVKWVGCGYHS